MNSKHFKHQSPGKRNALRGAGLGALAAACVATGCATGSDGNGGQADLDRAGGRGSDCIFSATIRDFTTLDDQNLILDAPGSRAYHVVLMSPSLSLESEFTIGVLDRDGDRRICPFGRDRILIDGPLREQIPIRSITQIDEDEVEGLKVRFGLEEAAPENSITVTEVE